MAVNLNSYNPSILVDIYLDGGTQHVATRDFYDGSGNYYKGTLKGAPEISQELSDLYYGVEQSGRVTLRIANSREGEIDKSWDTVIVTDGDEPRNRWVRIQRYDPTDGTSFEFRGRIVSYSLGPIVEFVIEMRDDDVLETLLPLGIVNNDTFATTALDLGEVINICFGYCRNVPLRNIQNDTVNNHYDYLIGYKVIESLWIDHANDIGVKRDGVLVDITEYGSNATFDDGIAFDGSQATPWPGYAFIRFTTEQMDYSGAYHKLTADVYGLELGGSAERNFAYNIERFFNGATWGLNDNTNATLFSTAATDLLNIVNMYCDGAIIEKRQARDILGDLLFPARGRVERGADGKWALFIDKAGASIATFGDNDGYYNNAEVVSTSAVSTDEALQKAIVHYSLNPANQERPFKEMETTVHIGFGVVRTYELPFVLEDGTAEKVLNYLKNRSIYSDNRAIINVGMEGRDLTKGQIITVTAPTRNLTSKDYIVERIMKGIAGPSLDCREYDANIYGAFGIGPPSSPHGQDYVVQGTRTLVGNIILGDGVNQPATVTLMVAPGKGDTYIGAGTVNAAAWTCNPGFLMGIDDSDGDKAKLFVGDANSYLNWDGTTLYIKGLISIESMYALPSDENLVGYWSLDDGSGAVAIDGSGNGNDGALQNMEEADWKDGYVGKCLDFDGADEYIDIGLTMPANSITLTAWIYSDITAASDRYIQGVQNAGNAGGRMLRFNVGAANRIQFEVINDTPVVYDAEYDSLNQDQWYFVVGVLDTASNEVRLYIDGELKDTTATAGNFTTQLANYKIGRRPDGAGANFFDGKIDEVRIYNTVLTESEIKALYLYPAGSKGSQISGAQTPWAHSSDITKMDGGNVYVGSSILVGTGVTAGSIAINDATFGNAGIQLIWVNDGGWKAKFYAGDGANEYLKYIQGTGISISTAQANAITIKGGADILVEGGGDIILTGNDADPATLFLVGGTYTYMLAANTVGDNLWFGCTTDGQGALIIGRDRANSYTKTTYIEAQNEAKLLAHGGATDYANVRCVTTGANLYILIGINDGTTYYMQFYGNRLVPDTTNKIDLGSTTLRWKHTWTVDLTCTNCITEGTCEIIPGDALAIISDIVQPGSGIFNEFGHERFDMARLQPKYPWLFVKEGDKEYLEKVGTKSDLLYQAVIQLDERLKKIED